MKIAMQKKLLLVPMMLGLLIGGADAANRSGQEVRQVQVMALDPCSIETIAASMGRKPGDFSREERQQMVVWCRGEYQMEKQGAERPRSASRPKGLIAPTGGQRIWCGLNNCVCWKGPKYNGCHHTDKLCGTPLKCVGRVCGCTTKD